jgi:hypothetical protein
MSVSALKIPAASKLAALKGQLARLLDSMLERVYGRKVAILDLDVPKPSLIEGIFRDGTKLLDFTANLETDKLQYKFVEQARRDSWIADNIDEFAPLLDSLNVRLDASPEYLASVLHERLRLDRGRDRRKPNQCKNGLPCGMGCIEPTDNCQLNLSKVSSATEHAEIEKLTAQLHTASQSGNSDRYSTQTIRQLQQEARDRGVYLANHFKAESLRETLRTLDRDPESQERLRKTLEKQREQRRSAQKALSTATQVLKGGKASGSSLNPGSIWGQIEKIGRLTKTSPQTASILTVALLAGISTRSYQEMRTKYKEGLNESAQMAMQRAESHPIERTNKPDLLFTVGGFASTGSRSERIRDLMTPQDGSPQERWFAKTQHVIPVQSKEFDIEPTAASPRLANGSYNPAYLGHVARQGMGRYLQNLQRGRNDAAVDLAASLYAHGRRYKEANLNLLAHGAGGNVTDEAIEILSRMKSQDGKGVKGKDMLDRINLVRMGSANFGFANDRLWRTMRNQTLTSSQDPFSALPKRLASWVSTVPGHEVDDYLKDGGVRERLRTAFGYYTSSLSGSERQAKQRTTRNRAIGMALKTAGLKSASQLWGQASKIRELAQDDPLSASLVGGALAMGVTKATYKVLSNERTRNLPIAAREAIRQSDAIAATVPNVTRSNLLFTVGGTGVSSAELAQGLQAASNREAKGDRGWMTTSNYAVPFEVVDRAGPAETKDVNSPEYLGHHLGKGFGSTLKSALTGGKNNDSTRLAAQLYAYGDRVHRQGTPTGSKASHLPINIVAYDTGGIVARDAVEILMQMKPNGPQIAKRVQLATLGTPGFGLYSKQINEVNVMGDRDPFSRLPFQRSEGKTTPGGDVDSHSIESYLKSGDVVDQLQRSFQANELNRKVVSQTTKGRSAQGRPLKYPKPNPADDRDPRNHAEHFVSLSIAEQDELMEKYIKVLKADKRRSLVPRQAQQASAAFRAAYKKHQEQQRKNKDNPPAEGN